MAKPQLESVADPIGDMRRRLQELALERDRLAEELQAVEAAPRPFEEAAQDIAEAVALAAARVQVPAGWLAQRPGQVPAVVDHLCSVAGDRTPVTAFPVLCWVLPNEVAEALQTELRRAYDRLPAPLPVDERERQEAELRARIAGIEAELARPWWQAVDAGVQLDPPDVPGHVLVGALAA
jgi:hypothetical protein